MNSYPSGSKESIFYRKKWRPKRGPEFFSIHPCHEFPVLGIKKKKFSFKIAGVQNRELLPAETSRTRPCHGLIRDPQDQEQRHFHAKCRGSKRAPLLPEPSRARTCHDFAIHDSADQKKMFSTPKKRGSIARAAATRAFQTLPR